MIENSGNDPQMLLQIAEELSAEEFTPETMAKMEELEIALSNFLEETNAALLEQEQQEGQSQQQPTPPLNSPLNAQFETNEKAYELQQQQSGWQERDLTTDLAYAGTALELLQQRLRQEEEVLQQAEWALPQESFQDLPDSDLNDEGVLQQAEEALRKSREAAEKRRLEAERRSLTAARVSAGFRRQQMQQQQPEQNKQVIETFGGVNAYEEESTPFENQGDQSEDVPDTNMRPTIELRSLTQEDSSREGSESIYATSEGADQQTGSRAPESIPILYNWVQDEKGCITGYVRGSSNFKDGAKISTSPVSFGAQGGGIVATESGSQ